MLEHSDRSRISAPPDPVLGPQRPNAGDGAPLDLRRNSPRRPCQAPNNLPHLEIGRVLGDRYVIEQRLGGCGKGVVFKALDRHRSSLPPPQCYVAVKVLWSREQSLEARQLELHRAQTLAHRNIISVFDFDRDENLDFFTMELLEGELLSDILRRCQPLPLSREHAWSIIAQIASGVEHAHERDIVHADLKPQNIMITNSGEVRILEFGAPYTPPPDHARTANHPSPSVTPAYACCELLEGRTPDWRDDLYALSCIAYELLTGTHPFQRRRANEVRDLGVVPTRPAGLSRRQWRILAKGLSWHRAARSMSVADWLKALNASDQRARRLPSISDLKPVPPQVRGVPGFKAPAIFTLMVVVGAVCLTFTRVAPGRRVNGQTLTPAAAVPLASVPSLLARDVAPQSMTRLPAAVDEKAVGGALSNPLNRHDITLSPNGLEVSRGQHFAEIRVHRNRSKRKDGPFVWWTEAASAKPGIDYVQQPKVVQSFPAGKDSASVFVKLLPRESKAPGGVFYIAVADKESTGNGQVSQAEIRLPPAYK